MKRGHITGVSVQDVYSMSRSLLLKDYNVLRVINGQSKAGFFIEDSTKSRNILGWQLHVKFDGFLQLMVKNYLVLEN